MSKSVIDAEQLNSAISEILNDYGDQALEAVNETVEELTAEAVKDLKSKSPKDSGKYAKGWRKNIDKSRTSVVGVVYNATSYQLTHLLEFGHARRNGGRKVDAVPHIAEVNDEIINKFEQEVMDKL